MKMPSVRVNFLYDVVYRIITLAAPLITAPYISRVIGASNIGEYSYVTALSSYFTIVAILGSNTFGQREIAYCAGDKESINRTFWNLYTLRAMMIAITSVAYLFFSLTLNGSIKVLFLLMYVDLCGLIFDVTWFYQGIEEFRRIFFRNLIMKSFSVFSVFIFVKNSSDFYLYVLINSLSVIFANLSLLPSLHKFVGKFTFSLKTIKSFIVPITKLFIPTVTLVLYNSIDKTMIGLFSNSYESGYYEQATKIIVIIVSAVTSINNVISPRISLLFKKRDYLSINTLLEKSFHLVWILSVPVIIGMFIVSPFFVPVFFGPGYEKVISLLCILILILIPMGFKMIIGMGYLVPIGNEGEFSISIIIGLITNVVANYLLIGSYGSVGACIASVFSEFVISIYLIFKVRKEVKINSFFSTIIKPLLASAFMYVCLNIVIKLFNLAANFSSLVIIIGIGVVAYGIGVLFLRDGLIINTLKEILINLRRRNQSV